MRAIVVDEFANWRVRYSPIAVQGAPDVQERISTSCREALFLHPKYHLLIKIGTYFYYVLTSKMHKHITHKCVEL